jgi:hypothetical protein
MVLWQVVFSHQVSGCVQVPGCIARGSEGPGEQVSRKGGTAGVPGRSSLLSSGTPHIPCLSGGRWLWQVCCWGVIWHVRGLLNHMVHVLFTVAI